MQMKISFPMDFTSRDVSPNDGPIKATINKAKYKVLKKSFISDLLIEVFKALLIFISLMI
jgi:hypothetical protein